jgi:hypothetical protein
MFAADPGRVVARVRGHEQAHKGRVETRRRTFAVIDIHSFGTHTHGGRRWIQWQQDCHRAHRQWRRGWLLLRHPVNLHI